MSNINDTFFDGYYKDIWKAIIPEELTNRESDFLINYFNLKAGNRVLDLCVDMAAMHLRWAEKE